MPFDPILVTLAEGLKETIHPFSFVSRQGFIELISVSGAAQKVYPILPKLVVPIKGALVSDNDSVFEGALEALVYLSEASGPALNQHLKIFLSIVSIKSHLIN